MSKLLMNERPLMVMPSLAVKIGLPESIFIQQLHYWLEISTNIQEGHKWVYNTVQEWQEQFPFWSISTLRRTIKSLEDKKLVITDNFNTMTIDKTKWYRINYEKLKKYESDCQYEQTTSQNEQSNSQSDNTSSHIEHSRIQVGYASIQSEQAEQSKRTDRVVNMNTPLPESTSKSTTENNYNNNVQAVDQPIENAFTFFEQNGFGMLGRHIADKIDSWIEDVSEELVLQAMKIAVENSAISWNYVETILRDWSSKKFKSISDYEAHEFKRAQEKSRKKAQSAGRRYGAPVKEEMVPKWFKQDQAEIEPVTATPAEKEVHEDIEERRRKLREDLARTSMRSTKEMGREIKT